jgi:uncharacterized membrane protein YbhN (UPF0104 family)
MSFRQAVFVAAKIVFAISVLGWLLSSGKVDAARVWSSVRETRLGLIAAGVGLCLLTVAIAGWRWHRLLRAFQIHLPLWSLTCIAQIGQFFMMFLPGPAGDDLTRMLYVSRLAKGRVGEACATVLLDRVIGLASVLLLALVCMPWQWAALTSTAETRTLALGIVAAGLVVCAGGAVFFALNTRRMLALVHWCVGRLPESGLKVKLGKIGRLVSVGRRAVGQVVLAAICTQLLLCVLFHLAGAAVGIPTPLTVWMSFVPVVLAANAIPITIAGLGVREYLLVLFLGVLGGIDGGRALAASLVVFAMILAVCLLGGVVYIFYRPKPVSEDPAAGADPAAR